MSIQIRIGRMLPERLKNFVAEIATPRVVERERELLDQVEHAVGVLAERIEREVRTADRRIGLLDSPDVRLALGDLRARTELFHRCLERDALGVEGLLTFAETAADIGVGGVRAATTADDAADAISRAVDHLQDYMLSNGFLDSDSLHKGHLVEPHDVRKLRARVSAKEFAGWNQTLQSHTIEIRHGPGSGRTTLA